VNAETQFLKSLFDEREFDKVAAQLIKEGQLTQETINALDIKEPEYLDQLENQAQSSTSAETEAEDKASPVEEEPQPPQEVEAEPPPEAGQEQPAELAIPATFFKSAQTHPLALLAVVKNKYNDEWVRWLPETLWETIRKDFGQVGEVVKNKIQAVSVALSTDAPWQDWTTFENCGKAFNDSIPVFGQIQPLSPIETAFTVKLLKKLNVFNFSDEVLGYIAAVCLNNGIIYAPNEWFDKAQPFIDAQNKNLDLKKEIEAAWKAVKKQEMYDVEFKEDSPLHVHIIKLWAVKEYLRDMETRLKEA
jgi:hypothetical protein